MINKNGEIFPDIIPPPGMGKPHPYLVRFKEKILDPRTSVERIKEAIIDYIKAFELIDLLGIPVPSIEPEQLERFKNEIEKDEKTDISIINNAIRAIFEETEVGK